MQTAKEDFSEILIYIHKKKQHLPKFTEVELQESLA